ncbi:gamma-soluble NSF attachment protein-like [Olea europaea var. sylvestris]|uniref:gamma-soluble NSF attachment protein-like n=1 Tax=Olea europaea var. sylvestris TaxID=158386 RepID=UPI000C1D17C4|nr:gamma-soluble NSF attachment protein-like [Olea europaea var. sylvestris]
MGYYSYHSFIGLYTPGWKLMPMCVSFLFLVKKVLMSYWFCYLYRYADAATFLLRLALAADKCNATHSQCKAYLSAIIVHLYAHDFQQAEKCYNDCCQVEAFLNSDQNRAASRLLSAYTEGDVEEIKRAAQSSIVSNLDHVIVKLARKLPTGDVSAFKMDTKDQEEPLDEDDLT